MADLAEPLEKLLTLMTEKQNGQDRLAFSRLAPETTREYYHSYLAGLGALAMSREQVEGELSVLLAIRLLWRLIPERVLHGMDPDFEALASRALTSEFGVDPSESLVRKLALIFRRVRFSRLQGRPRTRLDLGRARHQKLMKDQDGRCACCLYKFPDSSDYELDESDESYFREEYAPLAGEVFLSSYFRKPVLDHIIPYFLGGDDSENWQILCHSCNSGKGESLAWISRRGWLPPPRLFDATSLTPSLRYACLASSGTQRQEGSAVSGKQLRIFKIDAKRLLFLENLRVAYC